MLDKRAFLRTVHPFDRLDDAALTPIIEVLSSERFTEGEHILRRWDNPSYLYILTQGEAEELDSEGTVGRYSSGSVFDARGLIEGRCQHTFIARSVVRCYRLPAQPFLALIRNNPALGDFFYEEITRKLDALITVQQQREATSFMLARIGNGELRPPVFADSTTTIQQAVALMQAHRTSALLVKRGDDIGIFTSRDVREQLMLARRPESTPISEIANYQLISLGPDDLLFNALVIMTQHAIRHVVIRQGAKILGVLEQIDLLNYLSSHSQLVSTQIDRANSQQALQEASERIPLVIKSLYERGVKTRYISRLVTDLNRRLFRRLYELLLPATLADNACLVVMGSEGRGEQLLRTDQDNALILKAPFPPDELAALTSAFTEGLVALGYPRCPGNIMVSNPDWAKPLTDYRDELFRWVVRPDQNAYMNLAIFFDASPAAGDESLLQEAKDHLFHLLRNHTGALAHFAKAILSFETPLGLFDRFITEKGPHAKQLDIKKGGIFPIVHGVRS
ncbi:MAG: DUF294 nucleotidyltransferase-like domain-containing protein, partial [Candidatus Competibacteraceae bacterium]|nr:DUF294 nucleotidyltransferase-like domain-containing protein [Candidatus Competibacteraceae bacterium]